MEYHYRVTLVNEEGAQLVTAEILRVFGKSLKTYAIAYEVVTEKEGECENHHIHCHLEYLEYDEVTYSQRRQRMIKKLKDKKIVPDKNGAQYHEKLNKSRDNNLRYCLKGHNIIKHNLTDNELEEVNKENERIENEKKIPMKQQLINEWFNENNNGFYVRLPETKYILFNFIDKYHFKRDYLALTFSLLTSYAFAILESTNEMKKKTQYYTRDDTTIYFSVYCSLRNIRIDDMPNEKIIDKVRYDTRESTIYEDSDDDTKDLYTYQFKD